MPPISPLTQHSSQPTARVVFRRTITQYETISKYMVPGTCPFSLKNLQEQLQQIIINYTQHSTSTKSTIIDNMSNGVNTSIVNSLMVSG